MATPPILTPSQLSAFLTHINLPPPLHTQRYISTNPLQSLHLLTQLHIHTISTIPYENLWLHYSQTHTNTIAPLPNFHAMITANHGRGGYCFQLSLLFNHVLRALGFTAYLAPVRIRLRANGVPVGEYGGWRHVVNIITFAGDERYVVDVGFGGDGMTKPLRLVEGQAQGNLGMQEVRLVRGWVGAQVLRAEESRVWVYEVRNTRGDEWRGFYAFVEGVEALEEDLKHLNYFTESHGESFQVVTCLVVKFLRRCRVCGGTTAGECSAHGDEGEQEIYGKRMLVGGMVKENLGGRTRVIQECATEEERVEALKKWFGITLTQEEREGIKGWRTELRTPHENNDRPNDHKDEMREIWEITRGAGGKRKFIQLQQ
ncbi:cysteine proteinase [Plenodomus tracheiphilus IPT5]|uniref:Cysteine proteinase n=1 Tax=Plenodomus tracheiphilus IPT5 TaxID=1408161 RepID=A0A6A7AVS7_9PLEO|nr:cysteine proteinase [Plenodomus tracheiphilus IPT5]